MHGSYYFTDEFFQEFFIQKGDKDGDRMLSLEELANTKFDLKNSKLCQKQRSNDGVFEKIKKLIELFMALLLVVTAIFMLI